MGLIKKVFIILEFLDFRPLSRLNQKETVRENSGPESKENKGGKKGLSSSRH